MKILSAAAVVVFGIALTQVGCSAEPADEELDDTSNAVSYYNGRIIPETEVAQLVRAAGFPESIVGTLVCTAKYESRFYERAENRNGRSTDRGLFQINSVHLNGGTRGCPQTAEGLWDAETNTACAYAVYKGRQGSSSNPRTGLQAWYAYREHKSECDRYPAPTGSSSTPTPDEPDTSTDGDDPGPDASDVPGACWSATVGKHLEPGGCFQRQSDGTWFQCKGGLWYRGVNASGTSGPHGPCTSSYPL